MPEWLSTYEGQSVDELLALRGTHDEESIANALYQAIDRKVYGQGRDYSALEVTIPTVIELDREVKNGGFYQFLTNYSGRFESFVVDSLHNIRCDKSEMISKAALGALPADWKTLPRQEVEALLDPYDQSFFRTGENFYDALLDFVETKRSDFTLPD